MKVDVLRQKFLDFFKGKKHRIVQSDSLVPKDDPTVLFTPAGMNQFKKQFLGHLTGFSRAASSQRCLRTDDLDKVGKTPSHHTFFEMLGNFSFGDYFKEDAIAWAWEFLTEGLKIKKDKLWVSVYKDDDEAYRIWKEKIKVPENRIVKLGDKENFWPSEAKEKGPNGPCGPCSEIFFDQGAGCGKPDCRPSCNCGRFPEIWNLVFTQYNRKPDGKLEPLPSKNIDTGMGLERLAAVMQGAGSNFETDLFAPIISEIVAKSPPQAGPPSAEPSHQATGSKEAIYAVADHVRAITFAIYDGVLPSNEARGYVVRKIIRKSALHLRSLGITNPFLYKLVPLVSEVMKSPYPDLDKRKENISQIILSEEENFISTLNSSSALFEERFGDPLAKQDPQRAGELAFQLYDTYGIPLELTKDWLDKKGIKFSSDAFNKELEEQKNRSKLQSSMKGDVFDFKGLHLSGGKTGFFGYSKYEIKAKVTKIIKDSLPVKKIVKGDEAKIILDKTVFYPEQGGQVGDTGELIKGKNIFQVTDTQKFDKVIVHKGIVKEGVFKSADELKACVDIERRLSVERNHTATHLLQAALRKVLGSHVQQQGSLVAFDRLRFDFTHFKEISSDELDRIEDVINGFIINNEPLKTKTLSLNEAKKEGALAFFQDKYESKVRMVSVGDFSKELCGGTHLDSTGPIGILKIIQEGSVASGVRRIEAVTGTFAHKMIKDEERLISDISQALNVPKENIMPELKKRIACERDMEKELRSQKLGNLQDSIPDLLKKAVTINNTSLIVAIESNKDMDLLRRQVDMVKEKTKSAVIALACREGQRVQLVIGLTPDLLSRGMDASALIRDIAKEIGGSGGGRKDFAQAGGNKPENLERALEALKSIIGNLK